MTNINTITKFHSCLIDSGQPTQQQMRAPGMPGGPPAPSQGPAHMNNPPPQPGQGAPPGMQQGGQQRPHSKDEEDTMRNLRKTFAGIFGDM